MINVLPEPKFLQDLGGFTAPITCFQIADDEIRELFALRFWNHKEYAFAADAGFPVTVTASLDGVEADRRDLLLEQARWTAAVEDDSFTALHIAEVLGSYDSYFTQI